MNYYEHHLGDYAKDTSHLTMLEHGAYRLLLDRYYSTEAPIPKDQAHRVARARSKDEKIAVDTVLDEFFKLEDGFYVNGRADEEITKAQSKIKAAQENGKRGGRPKKNQDETKQKPTGLFLGYENETQTKAHQTPDTKHQSPDCFNKTNTIPENEVGGLTAGSVCLFLTEQGITHTNPSHEDLLTALRSGAGLDDFAFAATEVKHKGKGFAYLLKIVLGRMEEKKNPKVVKSKTFAGFTETEINKAARPGETRDQVIQRLAQQRDKQKTTG